jgi:hypothetical protein
MMQDCKEDWLHAVFEYASVEEEPLHIHQKN